MKTQIRQSLPLVMVFLTLMLMCDCGGEDNTQNPDVIYQKAEQLYKQGKVLEALRRYERLNDFKETKSFEKARLKLLKDGLSIGSLFKSWSLKQMFVIKNKIIDQDKLTHRDGKITIPYPRNDAWGKSFMIRYLQSPRFYFCIMSAGPDKKYDTDDDLCLYHKCDTDRQKLSGKRALALDTLADEPLLKRGLNGSADGSRSRSEAVVELEDLL